MENQPKPCDDSQGVCDKYPDCVCGQAWRNHTANSDPRQEVTLEEQIAEQERNVRYACKHSNDCVACVTEKAILASLRKLDRIRKAERPGKPPVAFAVDSYNGAGWVGIWKTHETAWLVAGKVTSRSGKRDIVVPVVPKANYDALTAYADRMVAERDALRERDEASWKSLYEKEVSDHAITDTRAESAEAKLAAVEKGLQDLARGPLQVTDFAKYAQHKAAELLRGIGEE